MATARRMTYGEAIQQAQLSLAQGRSFHHETVMAEMDTLIEEKRRGHEAESEKRPAPQRHKKPDR